MRSIPLSLPVSLLVCLLALLTALPASSSFAANLDLPSSFAFQSYFSDDEDHDEGHEEEPIENPEDGEHEDGFDDAGFGGGGGPDDPEGCQPASAAQKNFVARGNAKAKKFLDRCNRASGFSRWCLQLMRPNPSSQNVFRCTYGASFPHQLVHPNEATWANALRAVQIVRDLEGLGVRVAQIYNWWRPEPYNSNVGGARTRHPLGTSVDVRFSSQADMEKAHKLLCLFRKRGRLRALGYYGSTGLHFGVGDRVPNTWGKSCR
jgi:hypothetical protein